MWCCRVVDPEVWSLSVVIELQYIVRFIWNLTSITSSVVSFNFIFTWKTSAVNSISLPNINQCHQCLVNWLDLTWKVQLCSQSFAVTIHNTVQNCYERHITHKNNHTLRLWTFKQMKKHLFETKWKLTGKISFLFWHVWMSRRPYCNSISSSPNTYICAWH